MISTQLEPWATIERHSSRRGLKGSVRGARRAGDDISRSSNCGWIEKAAEPAQQADAILRFASGGAAEPQIVRRLLQLTLVRTVDVAS